VTEGADDLPSEATFFTGENLLRIVLALLSVTIFILVRNIVAKALTKPVSIITHKFYPDSKAKFEEALRGPISFLCIVGGAVIAGNILQLPDEFQALVVNFMTSLLDVMIFWFLFQTVEPISEIIHKTGTGQISDEMREVIVDLVKIGVVCVGFLTLLQAWGVNVAAFLAGLGLVGMAVALAAQDTMRNLFASVAMFADKSFKKDDWILTPEVEGTVGTVSLRTTVINNFDTSITVIPNANLANGTIINFNNCTHRRIVWSLPITAPKDEKFSQVVEKLNQYVHAHPKVDQKGEPVIIQIEEFGEACLKLFVLFYVNETRWLPFMEIKQTILLDFLRIVTEEGCAFGVPTRYVTVQNV